MREVKCQAAEGSTLDNLNSRRNGPDPTRTFLITGVLRMSSLRFIAVSYTLFLASIGLSFAEIFAVNGLFAFIEACFQTPTGVFADRYGRAKAVKIGTFVLACGSLAYYFANDLVSALLIEGMVGLGLAFVNGADEAWLKARLKERQGKSDLTAIFGRYETISGIVSIVFGVIGGYVAKDNRRLAWLPASGIAFISLFFVMLWMKDPPNGHVKEKVWRATGQAFRQILACARQMTKEPPLLWAAAAGCGSSLLLPAFFFWVIFFKARVGDAWLPLLWIPFFGSKALGAVIVARSVTLGRLSSKARMLCLVACYALGVPCLFVMGGSSGWLWPAVAFTVLEIAFGIFTPLFNGFVQNQITDDKRRATFKSMNSMCIGLGNTLVTVVMVFKTHGQKADDTLITLAWRQMGWAMLAVSILLFFTRPRHAVELPAQSS
jgi:MFS family permease